VASTGAFGSRGIDTDMTEFARAIVRAAVELAIKDDSSADSFANLNKHDVAEAREVRGAEPDFSQRRKARAIVEVQRNITQLRFQNVSHFDAFAPTEALRFTHRSGFVIDQSNQADTNPSKFAVRIGLPGEQEGLLGHRVEKLYRIATVRNSFHALQMAIQVAQGQKRFNGADVNADGAAFTWVDVNKPRFSASRRSRRPDAGLVHQALPEKAVNDAGDGSFFEAGNLRDAHSRNRLPLANDVQHNHFVDVAKDSVISRFKVAEIDFSHKSNLKSKSAYPELLLSFPREPEYKGSYLTNTSIQGWHGNYAE